MKINIRKSAIRDLNKVDYKLKNGILSAISGLAKFPEVANCKKLTNFESAYRIRVGNYRILFDVYDNEIFIGRVLHRKDCYRRS